jgi:tRNA(Phe) wybutosine-synthesizing methylase Tyw3
MAKYDSFMDPECVELCDALNEIPGITTEASCCGHEKYRFSVWFKSTNVESLRVIGHITSRKHMPAPQWKCRVELDDGNNVRFHLSSGKTKGKKAYKQASDLANRIRSYLK